MRGKTESGKVVSSHSSECGRSSFVQKFAIDSRSCSCSSVKPKWRRLELKSGLRTASAVAMEVDSNAFYFLLPAFRVPGRSANTLRTPMRFAIVVFACLVLAAPAAQAGVPRSFVGLYGDDAFFGGSDYRQQQFGMEARLGVGIVRQPFEWSRVERTQGHYDFSTYDAFVADAATSGESVLPMLISPPSFWSSRPASSTSRAMFPPSSNAAYARFVGAAVRRYGPTGSFWRSHPSVPFLPIHAWQVWNEPNIPNFWRSGVNAKEYVALLRAGSTAIRHADPHAEVVAAGLPNSNLGVPFLTFLDRMYEAGAKGLFDDLAIHPYSHNVQGLLTLAEQARSVMDRWGDRSRLWITEFGWSTGGDASAFRVSERGQANRISEALSALIAERRVLRLRG